MMHTCVSKQSIVLHTYVSSLIITVTVLLVLTFMRIMGPIYEGVLLPVTTNVVVEHIETDGDKMLFHAVGDKVRDCRLVDVKVLVDTDGQGPALPDKGVIYVVNDGIGDAIRPRGMQDLGIWAIHPEGKHIEVQAWYSCHPMWDTYTVLGTWDAGAKDVKVN